MSLICAKFGADLISTSKVTSFKTKWTRFFRATLYCVILFPQHFTDKSRIATVCLQDYYENATD